MRAFLASCFVAAFALSGCAVNTDRDESDGEADTSENAGALSTYGNKLVGAYETTVSSFDFDKIVLKSDGTYFATKQIWCITTPCEPLRDEGKFIGYKPTYGGFIGGLRLVSKKGKSSYYRVSLGKANESFKLAKSGTSKFVAFNTVGTYCTQNADCKGQSYAHIMCVGYPTCGAENKCGWKCGVEPSKCDYSDPTKSYIGKSVDDCSRIRYTCDFASGATSFSDSCGCGCTVPAKPACKPGGCSGQVCTDKEGLMTTCEWREHYACYQKMGICERGADGTCGWRETPELTKCIDGSF